MARIIAIAMQKGGVGKTTTAVNLAAAMAKLGKKVLAVDLDPQGNLTEHAGFDPDTLSPTIYEPFKAEVDGLGRDVRASIYRSEEGFDILPSQQELSLIELTLVNTLSRERVLETILGDVKEDYEYVLIDCGPSLGLLVINALTAADSVVVPVQTEYLAARGAFMVLSTIETVRRKKLNADLEIEGILLTMANTRTILTREIIAEVETQFGPGNPIFDPIVKRSIKFAESAAEGMSMVKYQPRSQGAHAYLDVANTIIERNENPHE